MRWRASALDIFWVTKRSMPEFASYMDRFERPLSITVSIPSIVNEVSATFVARTIFRPSNIGLIAFC